MRAYLDSQEIKTQTVAAMMADVAAERVIQGTYWNANKGNGCFVGCVIRGNDHGKFETQIGVPRILARLADRIFEGLNYEDAKKFTVDFLEAIPVGADLASVWPKFAHFMLIDPEFGVIKFAKTDRTKKSIQDIGDMYARVISGEKIDSNAWLEARRNAAVPVPVPAYAYADAYAYAAAYAAAAAADAAAYDAAAAAYAAADAAYAAYDADAADADAAAADAYAAAAYADAYAAAYAYAASAAAAAADAADAYAADADADAYAAARSRHYVALAAALIRFLSEAK